MAHYAADAASCLLCSERRTVGPGVSARRSCARGRHGLTPRRLESGAADAARSAWFCEQRWTRGSRSSGSVRDGTRQHAVLTGCVGTTRLGVAIQAYLIEPRRNGPQPRLLSRAAGHSGGTVGPQQGARELERDGVIRWRCVRSACGGHPCAASFDRSPVARAHGRSQTVDASSSDFGACRCVRIAPAAANLRNRRFLSAALLAVMTAAAAGSGRQAGRRSGSPMKPASVSRGR